LEQIKYVKRKDIVKLHNLLKTNLDYHGKIYSLIGIDGNGKTTLLKMLKERIDKSDSNILSVYIEIRQVDTAFDCFYAILRQLEHKISSKKTKTKEFLKTHQDTISTIAGIGTQVISAVSGTQGIPDVSGITPLMAGRTPTTDQQIQDELINKLEELLSDKIDKIIIMIDGISANYKNDYISMFEDIKKRLPSRVVIVVALSKSEIQSDVNINLRNFDYDETREFLTSNLKITDGNVINEIFLKSQGYPASLMWLRQNFLHGENISSLTTRLSRDGFLEQLQKNFFSKLKNFSEKELDIVKISSMLDFTDNTFLSSIINIDRIALEEILKQFVNDGLLEIVGYGELPYGQFLTIYIMPDLFMTAVRSIYGFVPEIYIKSLNCYAGLLLEGKYFNNNSIINHILTTYSNFTYGKPINVLNFLSYLNLSQEMKFRLCHMIVHYYFHSGNPEAGKEFIKILPELSENVNSKNFTHALTLYTNFLTDLIDHPEDFINNTPETLDEITRLILNEPVTYDKIVIESIVKMFKGLLKQNEDTDPIEVILNSFGISPKDKPTRILTITGVGEQFLGAANYDNAIVFLNEAFHQISLLTSEEENQLNNKFPPNFPYNNRQKFKDQIEYELGLSYYLKLDELSENENLYSKMEYMLEAYRHLEIVKSDPVRGQLYSLLKSDIGYVDKIIKRYTKGDESLVKGFLLFASDRNQEAVQFFEDILIKNPNDKEALLLKGSLLSELNNLDEAKICIEKLISIDPTNTDAWIEQSVLLWKLGQKDDAMNAADKATELESKYTNAWTNKASFFVESENYDEAIKCYQKSLQINSEDEDSLLGLGQILLNQKKYDEALRVFEKVLEIVPSNMEGWINKGEALFAMGRFEEAIIYSQKAIYLDTNSDVAWYNNSSYLVATQNVDDALNSLETAIRINRENIDFAKNDINYDSVRNDPRFKKLLEISD